MLLQVQRLLNLRSVFTNTVENLSLESREIR